MAIAVLYEDADCVVVNKPAGMPSHPMVKSPPTPLLPRGEDLPPFDKGGPGGISALEAVCELYPEIAIASPNPLEGGLVHRLDTGTSGCLVFARNPAAYAKLRHAFSNGLIEKTYVARVEGEIKEPVVIDYPIAHHPKNKAKMIAVMPKNKYFRGKPQPARTEVVPLEPLTPTLSHKGRGGYPSPLAGEGARRADEGCVVRVRIQGGRRHQIRVHLAVIGHPLVGDVLYGAKPVPGQPWHALHAESVILLNGKIIEAPHKSNPS